VTAARVVPPLAPGAAGLRRTLILEVLPLRHPQVTATRAARRKRRGKHRPPRSRSSGWRRRRTPTNLRSSARLWNGRSGCSTKDRPMETQGSHRPERRTHRRTLKRGQRPSQHPRQGRPAWPVRVVRGEMEEGAPPSSPILSKLSPLHRQTLPTPPQPHLQVKRRKVRLPRARPPRHLLYHLLKPFEDAFKEASSATSTR
jgi:hypothetical protein